MNGLSETMFKISRHVGSRPKVEPPRSEHCIDLVDTTVGDIAGKWFVKATLAKDTLASARTMANNIKAAVMERMHEIDWIDNTTRQRALEKVLFTILKWDLLNFQLERLKIKVGFPEFIMNPIKASERYQEFAVVDDYFQNIINANKFSFGYSRDLLFKPVDRDEWAQTPITVNAYYTPIFNEIAFPAGILRFAFFDSASPSYLNYGALGMIIGHEFTHAFDDSGYHCFIITEKLIITGVDSIKMEICETGGPLALPKDSRGNQSVSLISTKDTGSESGRKSSRSTGCSPLARILRTMEASLGRMKPGERPLETVKITLHFRALKDLHRSRCTSFHLARLGAQSYQKRAPSKR